MVIGSGIIKYPFWQMTAKNPNAIYACINYGEAYAPTEIVEQSICLNGELGKILRDLSIITLRIKQSFFGKSHFLKTMINIRGEYKIISVFSVPVLVFLRQQVLRIVASALKNILEILLSSMESETCNTRLFSCL